MKELENTRWLMEVVFACLLVLITGLVTHNKTDVKYVLSPAESLALLNDSSEFVTPQKAYALLKYGAGKAFFIDVRTPDEFNRSHIKNAINIPTGKFFTLKHIMLLRKIEKEGHIAVLFGETQQQASGPWLMLRQSGFENVKLFTGVYSQLDPVLANSIPQYSETPLIDTTALKSNTKVSAKDIPVVLPPSTQKKKVAPVKRQRETSSEEGC